MPRYRLKYTQQADPASRAQQQASALAVQQRQAQTSAYAAARFNEWAAGAQDREALLNARVQNAESQAEMAGAQFRYNLWKDNELRAQTTHYYNAMPAFQETLKQLGITPGSDRYRAEMASFASTIPDALTHNEAIRKELSDFSRVDATADQIAGRIKTFKQGMNQAGLDTGSIHMDKSGDISGGSPQQLPEKIVDRYAKLQGAIELHQAQAATQKQSDMSKNIANNPYAQQAQLNAAQKDSAILLNAYPKLGGLNPAAQQQATTTSAQGTQTPVPSPTPNQTPIPSPTPATTPNQTPANQIPNVSSKDDYDAIPGGSQFMSNGTLYTKPVETPQPNQ